MTAAPDLILVIDQGTTGTTAMLFDASGAVRGRAYREITQSYPAPGLVEHDPEEIFASVESTIADLLQTTKVDRSRLRALGITNQRETTILWERATGRPVHLAIVWQDRRTTEMCRAYAARGLDREVEARTGLKLDPYFSGTKIRWLLDQDPALEQRARAGGIAFGTIDSWILWRLTGGKVHATDWTNASRTLLYNIHDRAWDETLLTAFDIPAGILPIVHPASHHYGDVATLEAINGVPITALIGDQQAALAGHACFAPGETKNTYGTGLFTVMNLGGESRRSKHGLLTTLAVGEKLEPVYAFEGSVFIAGAAIQWLRDELKIITNAAETEALAESLKDNEGVYLVPAFTGLGTPHWEPRVRGTITGLTRGAGRAHLARAALESMAYQTLDVIAAMKADSGLDIPALKVDGGAVANNFLMQFQSDMLDARVVRPTINETTALGAAYLAGLATGLWPDTAAIRALWAEERSFEPRMAAPDRDRFLAGWRQAMDRTLAGLS